MFKNLMRSIMSKKPQQSSSSSTGSSDQFEQDDGALPASVPPKMKRKNTHDDSESLGEELAGVSTRVKSGSMKSKAKEEVKVGGSSTTQDEDQFEFSSPLQERIANSSDYSHEMDIKQIS